MTTTVDLGPAARRMARLVEGTPDDALDWPTPCADYAVADLLDHISGATLAFEAAARKQPLEGGPSGNGANLAPDWRASIPRQLAELADAWRDPAAWRGTTAAGGVELPGEVAGVVALDELVIHGWDLAKATGQPADYVGPGLDTVLEMVRQFRMGGIEGLFGPEVPVSADAPLLDRILGLAGRDPRWQPPRSLPTSRLRVGVDE
ncbi:MAG TPA: TIGR03086 family metal-binding protein [Acidimicrobiales bacterium]|nr:TIGR03086 family metal-binding protein [Acidimicrobiales bacterium]